MSDPADPELPLEFPEDLQDDDGLGGDGAVAGEVQILTAELGPDDAGDRLDRVLTDYFTNLPDTSLSRARLQGLIAEGHLTHDGTVISDGKHKARAGLYTLSIPAPVSARPRTARPADRGAVRGRPPDRRQ